MDRFVNYEHLNLSEATVYNASTLNLHGLPFDHASLLYIDPPHTHTHIHTHVVRHATLL